MKLNILVSTSNNSIDNMNGKQMNDPIFKLTYPTGNGIADEPVNSPGPAIFRLDPKSILHSLRNETVQKGRTKSWLSI